MAIGDGWVDGAWQDAGWVSGAWTVTGATKTIGGTSQLEAFSSSGGIDILEPETIGATSQLGAITSSGGLTVASPKTIGATAQLQPFTSNGTIDSGEAPDPEADQASGGYSGFWADIDRTIDANRNLTKRIRKKRRKVKKIESKIDQDLFIMQREIEEAEQREAELNRLTELVYNNRPAIVDIGDPVLIAALEKAVESATFSSMEELERRLIRQRRQEAEDDELFLLAATKAILRLH